MIDINKIAAEFQNKTLSKEQWTHNAHFAVAFVFLEKYKTIQQTLPKIRENIKSYNEFVGTANTDNSGYHETLTIFWLKVVYEYRKLKNVSDINETYREFIQTIFANAEFPLKFYSKELLFSKLARLTWVEPDILTISEIDKIMHLKK